MTTALSSAFYIAAYLLAVVDGMLQPRELILRDAGRTGWLHVREHPCIVAGAICGVIGVVLSA